MWKLIKKNRKDITLVLLLAVTLYFALWQHDKIYDLKQELRITKLRANDTNHF